MLNKPKQAVHFGAGQIGRGFIGPLLISSGYHVTFLDIQDEVITALNHSDHYTLHSLSNSPTSSKDETIQNFSGINSANGDDAPIEPIVQAEIVTTSVGPNVLAKIAPVIAKGISRRRKVGGGELTVIACENMIRASSELGRYVSEALKGKDEDIEYLNANVGFADCEVDRIVPGGDSDGDDEEHGLTVGVERFYEWIVEKKNIKGGLEIEGMQLQDTLDPFFDRKLYTLNCGHVILAFLGYLKGYTSVKQSFDDKEIQSVVRGALEESGAAMIKKHGFDAEKHREYIEKTMQRYANPNIDDQVSRVARNPKRKLSSGERLVGPVEMCREFGLERKNLLRGVAAGFLFDYAEDEEANIVQQIVKDKGIHKAVVEVTGFSEGSDDLKSVVKEYDTLKASKK